MTSLKTRGFYYKVYSLLPLIFLLISVLNEFDFNYLNLDYFSFNFPFILIFYFKLIPKNPNIKKYNQYTKAVSKIDIDRLE